MDPEWLDWIGKLIVPAISGAGGAILGALIGAQLTTRRERWNLRRELYFDLMKELVELDLRVVEMALMGDQFRATSDPQRQLSKRDEMRKQVDVVSNCFLRVARALAVARIVIRPSVAGLLDKLKPIVLEATDTTSGTPTSPLSQELAAAHQLHEQLAQAVRRLLNDARADLLGVSGWVPAESLERQTAESTKGGA